MAKRLDHCTVPPHNGNVLQASAVNAPSISKAPSGAVYAFPKNSGPYQRAAMVNNVPIVETIVDVVRLQEWATTVETIIPMVPACHRPALMQLFIKLDSMLYRHQQDHEEIVTQAPTPEDMIDYLSAYLAAMAPKEAQ
jgi:hypothetical protein